MVSFSELHTLDPYAADLARELTENAGRQRSSFVSIVNIWMAFNGWLEAVTGETRDARMITAIAENRRVNDAYERLLGDPRFRRKVTSFASSWPVVNVRDARRKLGRDAFWRFDRN